MRKLQRENDYIQELKNLHQVITKNYHDEITLFQEYLSVGKKLFNLETGIVSKIENSTYTVLSFSSPLEGLEEGLEFPLQDTYCREVFARKETVAIAHVGADKKMCLHPVYLNMKLESYISAPIYVEGSIFGTLNFTDRRIRDDGFSSNQFDTIEIMAKTIGRFLESQLNKSKVNQLLAMVSHDLKSPLGRIMSLTHLALEEEMTEDLKEYIEMIQKSSTSCLEMVRSILDIDAIENRRVEMKKSEVSLKKLLTDSWENVKHLATAKSITFESTGEELTLNVDPDRLKQALTNLLSNAIKFSHSNGVIKSTWSYTDDEAQIHVTDHGVGMTQQQVDSVFNSTKTTSTPGTVGERGNGYGLPLAAKIIAYHEGSIRIESEVGKGSTFIISLPFIKSGL